jgi:23S rRNA (pseudouridine1915-N3)-methyltransferase
MKIDIFRVAKGNVDWSNTSVNTYLKRIQHRWNTKEIQLKLSSKNDIDQRKRQESEQILSKLKTGDRLVVLDERGEGISTETLAKWIEDSMNSGTKRMVFAIGGPYGHDPILREKAWKTLAVSSLILNHEIARIVLAEQLYRASTIIYGGKYHH